MRESTERAILWEQAKGLMRAITASYEHDPENNFEKWQYVSEKFIDDIEDNGIGGFT